MERVAPGIPRTTVATIIGTRVDPTTYAAATGQVMEWARARESRYVCIANAHDLMLSYDQSDFRLAMNAADLVTPDGMPLAWLLRLRGYPILDRVYGPTLMQDVIDAAAAEHLPVGLYGGLPDVLQRLTAKLSARCPDLTVAYAYSPPFRDPTEEEDAEVCRSINHSGARILFVGIGTPKQVRWMAAHRGRIQAVMLGVGAAFDFLAGAKKQAPPWMQKLALEWLFRLMQEPGRLWKRYLWNNPRFAVLAAAELLGIWRP